MSGCDGTGDDGGNKSITETVAAAVNTAMQGTVQTLTDNSTAMLGAVQSLTDNSTAMQGTVQSLTDNSTAMLGAVQSLTDNSTNMQGTVQAMQGTVQTLADNSTAMQGTFQTLAENSTAMQGTFNVLTETLATLVQPRNGENDQDRRQNRERPDYVSRQSREHSFSSSDTDNEDEHFSTGTRNDSSRRSNRSHQSIRRSSAKLPVFTGKEAWKVWYNRFHEVAERRGWNNDEKLDELLPLLQGPAGEFVYGQLSRRTRSNYPALTEELKNRYRVVETTRTFAAQFRRRNQRGNESAEEYAAELKHLYDKAFIHRHTETRKEDLLRQFLDGLYDDKARFQVEYVKEPKTIDEAVSHVVNFMETRRWLTNPDTGYSRSSRRPVRKVSDASTMDSLWGDSADEAAVCNDTIRQHKTTKVTDQANQDQPSTATVTKEDDRNLLHDLRDRMSKMEYTSGSNSLQSQEAKQLHERMNKLEGGCVQPNPFPPRPFLLPPPPAPGNLSPNSDGWRNVICYACNQSGHIARDCGTRKMSGRQSEPARGNNSRYQGGRSEQQYAGNFRDQQPMQRARLN